MLKKALRQESPYERVQKLLGEISIGFSRSNQHRVHLVLWDSSNHCYHSYFSNPRKTPGKDSVVEAVEDLQDYLDALPSYSETLRVELYKWIDYNTDETRRKSTLRTWLKLDKSMCYDSRINPDIPDEDKNRTKAVQMLLSALPMYKDFDIAGKLDRCYMNGERRKKWFGFIYEGKNKPVFHLEPRDKDFQQFPSYTDYLKRGFGSAGLAGVDEVRGKSEEQREFYRNHESIYEGLYERLFEFKNYKAVYIPIYISEMFYGFAWIPIKNLKEVWNRDEKREALCDAVEELQEKTFPNHLTPVIQSLYPIEFKSKMNDAIETCNSIGELHKEFAKHINYLVRCKSCQVECQEYSWEETLPLTYFNFDGEGRGACEVKENDFTIPLSEEHSLGICLQGSFPDSLPMIQEAVEVNLQQHYRLVREQFASRMRMLRSARRAAVAAIMSRNMSHNIGSHVLAKLSSAKDFRDHDLIRSDWEGPVSEFNEFLRTRMDFIADVATSTPAASIPVEVYQDAIAPFAPSQNSGNGGQKLLINHISGVKSLGIDNISITVVDSDGSKISKHTERDIPFSSPNGLLGAQALYIILENVIRNSAKHAYEESSDENLEITIRINEEVEDDPDLLEVNIFDNLGNGSKTTFDSSPLSRPYSPYSTSETRIGQLPSAEVSKVKSKGVTDKLNELITDSIIDKDGGLKREGWGVREMKICAAYLREVYPENLDDSHSPALLTADEFDGNLGYRFYLRRPKEVLILDTDAQLEPDLPGADEAKGEQFDLETWRDNLRRAGIEYTTDKKVLEEAVEHHFLIVVDPTEEIEDILEDPNSLPFRIFIASSDSDASSEDFGGLPVVSLEELYDLEDNFDPDQFLLNVREMWHHERHYGERLFLYFDTDENSDRGTVDRWRSTRRVCVCEEEYTPQLEEAAKELIVLDRHGDLLLCDDIRDDSGKARTPYEPYNLSNPAVYQLLNGAPQNRLKREKLALEMIEAGATGIGVLDERIQALLEGKTEDFPWATDQSVLNILNCTGVWVPDKNDRDLDYPKQIDSDPGDNFFDEEVVENIVSRSKGRGKEFLVVHLGILEKLYKGDDQEDEIRRQVRRWEQEGIEVVIISGRGSPPMAQKLGTRFLHYSQVAKHLTKERSKYHLCKALFSSRRLPEQT